MGNSGGEEPPGRLERGEKHCPRKGSHLQGGGKPLNTKSFRILICKPGGRYGRLPSSSYMLWLDRKPQKFRRLADALREIDRIRNSAGFKAIPPKYRPTYKVV